MSNYPKVVSNDLPPEMVNNQTDHHEIHLDSIQTLDGGLPTPIAIPRDRPPSQ
jgi:hypothetical protein